MHSCPNCRLLLESVEWHGIPVLACRSCGGTWIGAGHLAEAVGERRADLAELNALYAGSGNLSAFAGLDSPCPECRAQLSSAPLALGLGQTAKQCPACGGAWLDPSTRSALSSTHISPAGLPQPAESPDQSTGDDPVLAANADYSRNFQYGHMAREPRRKVAVLTCMDSRMRIYEMLGMQAGDLNVIRNAGGIVTEDSLRSLILSHHLLGTKEFYVINHTDCGLMAITDQEFRSKLVRETGASSAIPSTFHAFTDLAENVREQMRRLRSHPWIPESVRIRGFVYNVRSGELDEVAEDWTSLGGTTA